MMSFCIHNQCTAGTFGNEPSCAHYTPSFIGGGCIWRTWFDRCLSPVAMAASQTMPVPTTGIAKKTISTMVIALLICLSTAPAHAGGWDFYFFGVNTKTFKEADWKMVVMGAATSIAVHVGGHYAYAAANGISIYQDGCREVIGPASTKQLREFNQVGFALQHAVGLALTSIPWTRQTDFTRGYVVAAWVETAVYPALNHKQGDLYWSNHYGGNSDYEYAAYMAVATHNLFRVNWAKP
ncbi:hypothetical protein M0R72_13960 [Candidatus Pacearchaeota archaeon]|jgi:hypothetical protein|nr:hypothetical protein [Candidatus Pacearchaeota archaeon]